MIDAIKFREMVEAYERYYAIMLGEREGSELAQEASWCTHDARIELERFLLSHADAILALVEDGWQPIETAPRDGTQVLACAQLAEHLTAKGYAPDLSIVKWDDREQDFIAMADGYMSVKSQGDMWTTYHEPFVTHWRPLPPPPETKP